MKLKDYLDKEYPTPHYYNGDLTYITDYVDPSDRTNGLLTNIVLKTEGWFKYTNKAIVTLKLHNQEYTISLCDSDVEGNEEILVKTFKTKVEKIKKLMLELNTL